MASRGAHEFPFILTSDGSMDIYPSNTTSKFKILLSDPLEIGDEDWEVALQSINYPYTWTNIGESAKTSMKYYIDHRTGVKRVVFPDWHCETIEEIIGFIASTLEDLRLDEEDAAEIPRIKVALDELGRFTLKCNSRTFDVGFSDNLLKLLGLNGHKHARQMTMKNFDRKQRHRKVMDKMFKRDKLFPLHNPHVRMAIEKANTMEDLLRIVTGHIDWTKFTRLYTPEYMKGRDHPWVGKFHDVDFTEQVGGYVLMEDLMYHLKELFKDEWIPMQILGETPCIVNPVQRMYIYTNIIEPLDMNDQAVKLLKLVNTRGSAYKTTHEEFSLLTYLPVQKGKISMIEVLIADESGDPVPFQIGTLVLTLHFRRVRRR